MKNIKNKGSSLKMPTETLVILPLGKVGSSLITNVDIDMLRRVMLLMTGRQQPFSQEKCLELLMNQELQWMVLENYSQGDVSTKPFDSYVDSIEKERSMAPGSFLKMIQDHGISLEFFKKYLLTSLFWQEYVQEKIRGKINRQKIQKKSEEKTQKIVEDYREKWSCPYYTVLEISIPVDLKEGEKGKAKAFQLMNGILEQMQKKKTTFDALAKKYSFGFLGFPDGIAVQQPEKKFPQEFLPLLRQSEPKKLHIVFLEKLSCLMAYVIIQRLETQHLLDTVKTKDSPGVKKIYQNVYGSFMSKEIKHFSKEILSTLRQQATVYKIYYENLQRIK